MTDLDDRLREHFGSLALSPEALARVHDRARAAEAASAADAAPQRRGRASRPGALARLRPASPRRRAPHRRITDRGPAAWLRAVAPRAVLASLLVGALAVGMHLSGSLGERTERTLREVAMNHATRLTFEFEEDSLAGLDRRMQLLPFEMAAPGRLPEGAEVLGSRYCSLAGRLAAHVKLRDAGTGRPLSLFVTSSASELDGLDGDGGRVDGVEVELFEEGGLFYALARQAG